MCVNPDRFRTRNNSFLAPEGAKAQVAKKTASPRVPASGVRKPVQGHSVAFRRGLP